MEYERASGIPSGLIACFIGGMQLRIGEITPRSADLYSDVPLPDSCEIEFSFYHPENGSYRRLSAKAQKNGQTLGADAAGSVRFIFDDAACAAEIRKTLRIWSEYVNMKLFSEPESFAQKYSGYPKDTESFCESMESQYKKWFSRLRIDKKYLNGMECALELSLPSTWMAYIKRPMPEFLKKYAENKHLPNDFFENIDIRRLYIGSEDCFHLFPDGKTLAAIAEKAQREQIFLSFATPILHQDHLFAARQRLDEIEKLYPQAEIIANDWGMLNILKDYNGRLLPVFGTLINRFRRDARLEWKAGVNEKAHLLSENALNDPCFMEFLKNIGVRRFEYACSPRMQLPDGKKSIHFPFYPTNTSAFCPLKAYIEYGNRGKQCEGDACQVYCEDNAFLYPQALNMIHRTRSIFALAKTLPDENYLRGFDRIVFNF